MQLHRQKNKMQPSTPGEGKKRAKHIKHCIDFISPCLLSSPLSPPPWLPSVVAATYLLQLMDADLEVKPQQPLAATESDGLRGS